MPMLTTVEAAARLGITPNRLRALAEQGRIVGARRPAKYGETWRFPDPPVRRAGHRGPKPKAKEARPAPA